MDTRRIAQGAAAAAAARAKVGGHACMQLQLFPMHPQPQAVTGTLSCSCHLQAPWLQGQKALAGQQLPHDTAQTAFGDGGRRLLEEQKALAVTIGFGDLIGCTTSHHTVATGPYYCSTHRPMAARRVVVTGATGLLGRRLCAVLREKSFAVTAVSRDPSRAQDSGLAADQFVGWEEPEVSAPPAEALAGAHAVVHLLGETVNPGFGGRWTEAKKASIMSSRVLSTRNLVQGLKAAGKDGPSALICGSAIGWYGERGSDELGEDEPAGHDFLAEVSVNWEREALAAEQLGVRVARLRTGIVMSPEGGALAEMLLPSKLGFGGPLGGGAQYWSWIGPDDIVQVIVFLLENDSCSGAFNGTAPQPITQAEFAKVLGAQTSWHGMAPIPLPGFVLSMILGEFSSELLSSKRVLPTRLLEAGFEFQHPDWKSCCENLMK
eukprot:SAG22_NODE_47_length_24699_cov_13.602317_6_plen_434_part_00